MDLISEEHRCILDESFRDLVASMPPPPSSAPDSSDANFVKRVVAPQIQIMYGASRFKALALSEKGLIGQFTGIWPSPKTMDAWINKIWIPLISGGL